MNFWLHHGYTLKAVADAAGVGVRNLVALRAGEQTWIHSDVRDRIMACVPALEAPTVPAIGSARRIRALVAMGWRYVDLEPETGISSKELSRLATDSQLRIGRVRAGMVAEAYDRLSMTTGPSSKARVRARRKGWAPPLAWDDETIDDPMESPEEWVDNPDAVA